MKRPCNGRGGSGDPWATLVRVPALAALGVGALAIVAGTLAAGIPGLIGSGIGVIVTVAFFTASLLVMSWTSRLDPMLVMGVALLTYGTKVGLLGLLLIALFDATWLSGMALALTVIACTAAWLVGQVVASLRARISVYDVAPRATRDGAVDET